jgi:hypothetical protein
VQVSHISSMQLSDFFLAFCKEERITASFGFFLTINNYFSVECFSRATHSPDLILLDEEMTYGPIQDGHSNITQGNVIVPRKVAFP